MDNLTVLILALICFYTFWKKSAIFRVYTKWFLAAISIYGLIVLPVPLLVFMLEKDRRNRLLSPFANALVYKLLDLEVVVEGRQNLVNDRGTVVLMNHQSILDMLVLGRVMQELDNCIVMSKKENRLVDPTGLYGWIWGVVYIDRRNVDTAKIAFSKIEERIRNENGHLLMFPEGTRNGSNVLLPFKKGGFHIALNSQCPIQPIVVSRYSSFLGKNRFDPGRIRIKILPAIPTKNYSIDNLDGLISDTYAIMSKNIDMISD